MKRGLVALVLFDIALTGMAFAFGWGLHGHDATPPRPEVKPQALVYCLLERTDFDPYSTTIETMTGAMRYCIAWTTRDRKGEIQ
jgi:hypothetical protein